MGQPLTPESAKLLKVGDWLTFIEPDDVIPAWTNVQIAELTKRPWIKIDHPERTNSACGWPPEYFAFLSRPMSPTPSVGTEGESTADNQTERDQ